ncbi:MAG: hypothetical protein M3O30_18730 [Planctomycetota bacterium]|nr:hypothetical protein [Planctomycetota bacterium]
MKSDLQTLKTREAMLLMYLAGELSEPDRAQVDQLLASDPSLAGQLASIHSINDFCVDALASLDRQDHLAFSQSASVRNATRLIRQWSVKHLLVEPPPVAQRRAIPWVRYGMSLAASVLVGYLILTGFSFNGTARSDHPVAVVREPVAPEAPLVGNVDIDHTTPAADPAGGLSTDDQVALLTDTSNVGASDDFSTMRLTADLDFLANNNP